MPGFFICARGATQPSNTNCNRSLKTQFTASQLVVDNGLASTICVMRFTPSQVVDLAGITAETLRYWKKSMPSLASKRGHAPCYTRAEIVGLIVLRQLTRDFKIDVSALAPQSDALFALCASQWALPSRRLLRVTCDGRFTSHEAESGMDLQEAVIVFPLDKAVQELDDRLNEQESVAQLELVGLLPVSVKTKARGVM